jgi:hypothetical protein
LLATSATILFALLWSIPHELQLAATRNPARLEQWRMEQQSLAANPQAVLLYTFEKDASSSRLLRNRSTNNGGKKVSGTFFEELALWELGTKGT